MSEQDSPELVVAKYGGRSMSEPARIAEIVETNPQQKFVVPSAAAGATDLLWRYRKDPTDELRDEIIEVVAGPAEALGSFAVRRLSANIHSTLMLERAKQDHDDHKIPALGEVWSANILGQLTGLPVVPYRDIYFFDGKDRYNPDSSREVMRRRLGDYAGRAIVEAYGGTDIKENVWTFPRGGSDLSAAELAVALGLGYENWTHVNGMLTAPPAIVGKSARPIPILTTAEVREGSSTNEVLMGDAVHTLLLAGHTAQVRNSRNAEHPGTQLVEERESADKEDVMLVTGSDDFVKITIKRFGLGDIDGYGAAVFDYMKGKDMRAPERMPLSWKHLPSGEDAMSVVIRKPYRMDEEESERFDQRIAEIQQKIKADEFLAPSQVSERRVGGVYLIGQRTSDEAVSTAVHLRAVKALARNGIHIIDPVSELESPGLGFLVPRGQTRAAIRVLHKEFFGRKLRRLFRRPN